jgi:MOSC domain-containing protein YiiM
MAGPVGPGLVVWIGLRPGRREPLKAVERTVAIAGRGLEGDRAASPKRLRESNRQVTLVAEEHLLAIGAFLGRGPVAPEALRRNVVVRGVNPLALRGRRFRLADALLEWTGDCHPCSRMEETFGEGGYNAVRGHGGITARVLEGGVIRVGDRLATQ